MLTDEERREIREKRERRRTWFGYLADDNVAHIGQRIERLLTGRRYAFVSTNTTYTHAVPDVRTGQYLTPTSHTSGKAVNVYRIGDPHSWDGKPSTLAGISVADSYGAWGMSSRFATEAEAREAAEDPEKLHHATYVYIEGGLSDDPRDVGRRDRIEVTFYNAMSPPEKLQWVIAVEPPIHEDDD